MTQESTQRVIVGVALEALFEFLFKYRPVVFEKGRIAFSAGAGTYILVIVAAIAAAVALLVYGRMRMRGGPRDRAILLGLRIAALAVVVLAVLHPVLVVSEAVPQRNVVGVLVDDSRSMRIADLNGTTRAEAVRHLLGGPDSSLYRALAEKFVVRLFRFSGNGGPASANPPGWCAEGDPRSGVGQRKARRDLAML